MLQVYAIKLCQIVSIEEMFKKSINLAHYTFNRQTTQYRPKAWRQRIPLLIEASDVYVCYRGQYIFTACMLCLYLSNETTI